MYCKRGTAAEAEMSLCERPLALVACILVAVVMASGIVRAAAATTKLADAPAVAETVDVAPVWSGHPVGFCLVTRGDAQYVAYYDKDRRLTVGKRQLGHADWHFVGLHAAEAKVGKRPPREDAAVVGWDSHNYIAMAFDSEGQLHLSGNMHVNPLVYFRTTRPGDIDSLQQVPHMVGDRETRCTYPRFIDGPGHELIFAYRDGQSGNGADIYNRYDPAAHAWSRLFDTPFTDGLGRMNAYCRGPICGPDGYFHICWTWRNSPDCSTNHDLCYARSRDLIHWETSAGKPLTLPITLETSEIVDAIPMKGGIINGNTLIGFDSAKRLVLSYQKNDADGNTQIYNARREGDGWKIVQASKWAYHWDFSGGGSIGFEIGLSALSPRGQGRLAQTWHHQKYGSGGWLLDEQTLEPVGTFTPAPTLPSSLGRVESKFIGMHVKMAEDTGRNDRGDGRYVLRWETLGANRDLPRPGEAPPPTMLRVYRITTSQAPQEISR